MLCFNVRNANINHMSKKNIKVIWSSMTPAQKHKFAESAYSTYNSMRFMISTNKFSDRSKHAIYTALRDMCLIDERLKPETAKANLFDENRGRA